MRCHNYKRVINLIFKSTLICYKYTDMRLSCMYTYMYTDIHKGTK